MKRYDKYKPSGIDWIGEVPEHWEVTRCRFISRLLHGMSYTPKDVVSEGEGTLVLRASNIQDSKLAFDDNVFIPSEMIPAQKMTRKGDIVICSTNGSLALCGKSALVKEDGLNLSFGSFMMVMRTDQNPIFIQYQLSQMVDLYRGLFATTTINQLTMDMLKDFSFILPPLEEQEAIAVYLDARCADIDKVVATQQKRIALLQELKQSEITQAVTHGLNPDARMKDSGVEWIGMVPEHWEVNRLGRLAAKIPYAMVDGPFGSDMKNEEYVDDGVPIVQLTNIRPFEHYMGFQNYITEEKHQQLIRHTAKSGDIVIAKMMPAGRACVLSDAYPEYVVAADAIRFACGDKADKNFLLYCLNSYCMQECELVSKGTTRVRINLEIVRKLNIAVPPIQEQNDIAKFLEKRCGEIDKQIGAVTKQIELLREYKQALITEVVTGKRKV